MKTGLTLIALAVLSAPLAASGAVMTLTPSPADLYDLDHSFYYTWGINSATVGQDLLGLPITKAVLVFKNITNWDTSANDLWVDLLDTATAGVKSGADSAAGDYFTSSAYAATGVAHTSLVHYANIPYYPASTLSYTFNDAQMTNLYKYIANGKDFAIGFDPECHYYNSGIELQLTYCPTPVPEPATLGVLAAGSLVLFRRRKLK